MSILAIPCRQPAIVNQERSGSPSTAVPTSAAGLSLAVAVARREFIGSPAPEVRLVSLFGRRCLVQTDSFGEGLPVADTRRAYRPLIYRTPTRI